MSWVVLIMAITGINWMSRHIEAVMWRITKVWLGHEDSCVLWKTVDSLTSRSV